MAYSLSFTKSILVLIFISDKTRRGETEFISTKVMSEIMDIPKPTLTVILSNLMRAGILQSKEGVNGGVRMAKSEENITLYDLLIAIESERPLFQTDYTIKAAGQRPESAQKVVNSALKNIESSVKEGMKKVTLREILNTI